MVLVLHEFTILWLWQVWHRHHRSAWWGSLTWIIGWRRQSLADDHESVASIDVLPSSHAPGQKRYSEDLCEAAGLQLPVLGSPCRSIRVVSTASFHAFQSRSQGKSAQGRSY
ncbi:hypothetical protein F4780DRAFT_737950 [Xylariomycetidae sp. FL0641]|nr:hypothetical protein F4780DRAFT_737950 [Xylariomycetidae sp. FL0641]